MAMIDAGHINWKQAVWRGLASFEFGYIEHNGLLIDAPLYRRILTNREALRHRILAQSPYSRLFPKGGFSNKEFSAFLDNPRKLLGTHDKKTGKPIARHIPGVYLESGELATNEKARRSLAEAYPKRWPRSLTSWRPRRNWSDQRNSRWGLTIASGPGAAPTGP